MYRQSKESGSIVLVVVILVLVVLGVGTYLVSSGKLALPGLKKSSEAKITLQIEVKNPFDKNAQYVNPFSGYKNPFDTAK